MKHVYVALLSGGLDSTVMIADAIHGGQDVRPLFFDYGQLNNRAEAEAANRVAVYYALPLEVVGLPHRIFSGGGSALLGESEMPRGPEHGISAAYVPGRNAVLISLAAAYAATIGATAVLFGGNAGDADNFPDCRPEFIEALHDLILTGTAGGVTLLAPYVDREKSDVAALGIRLRVPFEITTSCYRGADCGACPACHARRVALELAAAEVPA